MAKPSGPEELPVGAMLSPKPKNLMISMVERFNADKTGKRELLVARELFVAEDHPRRCHWNTLLASHHSFPLGHTGARSERIAQSSVRSRMPLEDLQSG
jgi:hypothetical protein